MKALSVVSSQGKHRVEESKWSDEKRVNKQLLLSFFSWRYLKRHLDFYLVDTSGNVIKRNLGNISKTFLIYSFGKYVGRHLLQARFPIRCNVTWRWKLHVHKSLLCSALPHSFKSQVLFIGKKNLPTTLTPTKLRKKKDYSKLSWLILNEVGSKAIILNEIEEVDREVKLGT